jgi:hypothetical protein
LAAPCSTISEEEKTSDVLKHSLHLLSHFIKQSDIRNTHSTCKIIAKKIDRRLVQYPDYFSTTDSTKSTELKPKYTHQGFTT